MLALISFKHDENIERKVNFFCDYFNLAAIYIGSSPIWDFENLLSIVDKIIFQIENNPENRNQYLTNHLKSYHFQRNKFTDKFKFLNKLRPLITNYLTVKNKNEWLNQNPVFLKILKRLKSELEKNMYNKAVDFVINYLRCPHDLDTHINDFKYLILIIISELKFKDKSKSEVSRVISKIMSKNVREFPLPQKIITEKNKEIFEKLSQEFMKGRTFTQQFEGIKNFNEYEDIYGYFIFQIHRLQLEVDTILTFNEVKIYNPKNDIFFKFRSDNINDEWTEFESEPNISIGVTRGSLTNYESGLKEAINKVQEFINYINNKLETNCYLNIYNHCSTPNFEMLGFGFKSDTTKSNLSEWDIEELNNDNPFERLSKINSQAKVQFLASEKYYQRALISNEPSDYWHYLECLIPWEKSGNQYCKQVKSVTSTILFLDFKTQFPTLIANCILNLLNGHSRERTVNSLAYNELNTIIENWSNSNILKIAASYEHHPIINSLISDYNKQNDKDFLLKIYKVYYDMLNELYEIRNAYIHSGIKNDYSDKKVKLIIPIYIKAIRTFFMERIENGKDKKIETIINKAKLKAQKILPEIINKD